MFQGCAATQKTSLATALWTILRTEALSSLQSNVALKLNPYVFKFRPMAIPSSVARHSSTLRETPSSASSVLAPDLKSENTQHQHQNTISASQSHINDSSSTFDAILPTTKAHPINGRQKEEKTEKRSSSLPKISRVPTTLPNKKPEHWRIQKAALKEKFKEGWNPPKKLSPDAIDGIRHLHATAPDKFTTPVLAQHFEMSPEAIRRILKSKWQPSEEERAKRRDRWNKRHDRIWSQMTQLGLRPKRKRLEGISDMRLVSGQIHGKS